MSFKPKPLPEELTAALRSHASALPAATPTPAAGPPARGGEGGRVRPPKTVQINFSASEDMARLWPDLPPRRAVPGGCSRGSYGTLVTRYPHADLNPPDNRRRWAQ